ncbi:MAG: SCO family protein [Pseudomonadota bacterium]|nr:SCO family protein [Pseudomonadota bacterium]
MKKANVWLFLTRLTLPLLVASMLTSCHSAAKPWHLKDVSGLVAPLNFTLKGENGQIFTQKNFTGKVVLLYFGYTHCPDFCPDTLAKLAVAMKKLGPAARDTQVIFVTVDPKRDTPALLKNYVSAFNPQFIGLQPSHSELRTLAERYRVTYTPLTADASGNYTISHSIGVFVFDKEGKARLIALPDDTSAEIAADVKRLVEQKD